MSREMSCLYKTFYRCPTYGENCGEKCRIYRETHQTKELNTYINLCDSCTHKGWDCDNDESYDCSQYDKELNNDL